MKNILLIWLLMIQIAAGQGLGEHTTEVINTVSEMGLKNQDDQALKLITDALDHPENGPDDLVFLQTYQVGLLLARDSVKMASQTVDLMNTQDRLTQHPVTKAMAFRARANLHSYLNQPDLSIQDCKEALSLLENVEKEHALKYWLNYQIYATYSEWDEGDKMAFYIQECAREARLAENQNFIANVHLGLASVHLNRYRKENNRADLDSNYNHLEQAYQLFEQYPEQVSSNTFVVACINLANYLLEFSEKSLSVRKQEAYVYLNKAEEELRNDRARFSRWVNVYGIKSDFAMKEGNMPLAEQYLIEALARLDSREDNNLLRLEYALHQHLSEFSEQKGDLKSALNYQQRSEQVLKQNFDQMQIANAQKLEVQYESEKKDQQLILLRETAALRQRQNYLYGGLAVLATLGLLFMFRAYHFKLRYSIERERKLEQEKEDAQRNAEMQVKLEKEEQARLKAEQDFLELKHQQLQKEALANSLMIEHKNDMLKQIQNKLRSGDPRDIQKLLREETLLNADFEDIKWQIQQLHPNFFQQLIERANQKLTALDLKYCAYIYLQMSTKQIAQVLHVEAQSVRMFKYRLKQKFSLPKEADLETFLQEVGARDR
ncbi:MAG: hypothetical protein ACTHZ1_03495 [Sphingobacterium sp.]